MLPREPEKQVLEIKLGDSILTGGSIRIAEGRLDTLEYEGYYTICPSSRFKDVKAQSERVFDTI